MKNHIMSLAVVAILSMAFLGGCISIKRDAEPATTTTTTTSAVPSSTTVQRTTTY